MTNTIVTMIIIMILMLSFTEHRLIHVINRVFAYYGLLKSLHVAVPSTCDRLQFERLLNDVRQTSYPTLGC